jgi:hypothetical protein
MSFRISVSIPHQPIPVPEDASQLDAWLDAENQFCLYDEPLGADGTIYEFWSMPASKLGLPMLTAIRSHGLQIQTPHELDVFEAELKQLQAAWNTYLRELPDLKKQDLLERMSFAHEAIRVARDNQAILTVG